MYTQTPSSAGPPARQLPSSFPSGIVSSAGTPSNLSVAFIEQRSVANGIVPGAPCPGARLPLDLAAALPHSRAPFTSDFTSRPGRLVIVRWRCLLSRLVSQQGVNREVGSFRDISPRCSDRRGCGLQTRSRTRHGTPHLAPALSPACPQPGRGVSPSGRSRHPTGGRVHCHPPPTPTANAHRQRPPQMTTADANEERPPTTAADINTLPRAARPPRAAPPRRR